MPGVVSIDGNAHPYVFFNLAKKPLALLITEGYRMTRTSGSSGSSDAVHVGVGLVREIVVDDEIYALHIYASGCNVCGNKNPDLSAAEALKCPDACRLGLVSMNRGCWDSVLFEGLGNAIGGMLHPGEYEGETIATALEDVDEKTTLVR